MDDPKYDPISAIMDYESGELDQEGIIKLFQYLVDTGLAWQLQGRYSRIANAMLEQGLITARQPAVR